MSVTMLKNTTTHWGALARFFHWTLGLLVIGMLAYGWWMNHIPARADKLFYRSIHADIGYVVLLLMLLRVFWRALNPAPALPADTPAWQRLAAHVSHWALYAVTITVALLGWAHSGAHKPDYADWFGLFRVPQFTSENRDNSRFLEHWHIYIAYVLMGLVAIHILAALYHHFIRRDRVMTAMIDGRPV
jgi:cytochrome b561